MVHKSGGCLRDVKGLYVSTSRWSRRVLEPARERGDAAAARGTSGRVSVFTSVQKLCPSRAQPGSARTGAAAASARRAPVPFV